MSPKIKKIALAALYFLPLLILLIITFKQTSFRFFFPKTQSSPSSQNPLSSYKKPSLPWLKTSGRFIVDEDNKPIILRGVNLTGAEWGDSDWFPQATEYVIKNWHANVIRTRIYQDEYFANPQDFFQRMEYLIINPARENGAYVILNPWIGNNDSLPNKNTGQMWQAIAQHYQNDPTIIYDILAEPHDVSRQQVWQANQKIIEAIRKVNPQSLILVTGIGWGREINSYLENPFPYENIVYRTNPYNKAGEFEGIFGRIARFYPVFIGEFGADGYPPMDQESVKALLAMADKLSLGWTAWNFHSIGAPCLLADFKKFTPSPYGKIVQSALLQKPTFATINPAPLVTNKKLIIYSDHLENSFADLSWDAKIDLINQENFYQDQQAIKVTIQKGWGALYLGSYLPLKTNQFNNLVFFTKNATLENFKISLIDKDGQTLSESNPTDWSTPLENGWIKINIPLKELHAQDKEITGFIFKDAVGTLAIFWIDQIHLE